MIEDTRLHIVAARNGETFAALVDRVGASWSAEKVAVANGLVLDASLHEGQVVKVPITKVYTGSSGRN